MFFITSINNRDYPLIMGTTIFYAIVLIAMLLIVDIAYMLIDPESSLPRRDDNEGRIRFITGIIQCRRQRR